MAASSVVESGENAWWKVLESGDYCTKRVVESGGTSFQQRGGKWWHQFPTAWWKVVAPVFNSPGAIGGGTLLATKGNPSSVETTGQTEVLVVTIGSGRSSQYGKLRAQLRRSAV